jgi:hypothetical protein
MFLNAISNDPANCAEYKFPVGTESIVLTEQQTN